jgi:hypothetical protein
VAIGSAAESILGACEVSKLGDTLYMMIASKLLPRWACGGQSGSRLKQFRPGVHSAQALYRPGLKKDELLRVACQIMQAGLERHCQSGMGFDVLVLGGQEEVLETRRIAARSD